ncbi:MULTISPECIES: hypothetical protein [unclassified Acidovorax]|uniref:hypothetical protein n=1 Tax=unclassified Acidovorax TaxID=2684926 RepID=UPI0028832FEC|nr:MULTISPECIES: hypothetical protein [unclassified Acidovorax]
MASHFARLLAVSLPMGRHSERIDDLGQDRRRPITKWSAASKIAAPQQKHLRVALNCLKFDPMLHCNMKVVWLLQLSLFINAFQTLS